MKSEMVCNRTNIRPKLTLIIPQADLFPHTLSGTSFSSPTTPTTSEPQFRLPATATLPPNAETKVKSEPKSKKLYEDIPVERYPCLQCSLLSLRCSLNSSYQIPQWRRETLTRLTFVDEKGAGGKAVAAAAAKTACQKCTRCYRKGEAFCVLQSFKGLGKNGEILFDYRVDGVSDAVVAEMVKGLMDEKAERENMKFALPRLWTGRERKNLKRLAWRLQRERDEDRALEMKRAEKMKKEREEERRKEDNPWIGFRDDYISD